MRRTFILPVLALTLCIGAYSQSNASAAATALPNFSGTWEMVEKGSALNDAVLVIQHSGNELRLSESFEFEKKAYVRDLTLYSDKRGERNMVLFPGADSKVDVRSKTFWKKDKLVRQLSFNENADAPGKRFSFTHNVTETYSLSKDGSTLTIASVASTDTPFDEVPKRSAGKRTYRRRN